MGVVKDVDDEAGAGRLGQVVGDGGVGGDGGEQAREDGVPVAVEAWTSRAGGEGGARGYADGVHGGHPLFDQPVLAVAKAFLVEVVPVGVALLPPRAGFRRLLFLSHLGYVGSYLDSCLPVVGIVNEIRSPGGDKHLGTYISPRMNRVLSMVDVDW